MRTQLLRFIEEFGDGRIPDTDEIEYLLEVRMGIRNAKRCRKEIKFLEELMSTTNEDDYEPPSSVLRGIVALIRYCRFLFFGSQPDKEAIDYCYGIEHVKPLVWQETLMTSIADPTEFICPISLDVMQYPVVVSTGHTYDRTSISQWIEQNRFTCPKARQRLTHNLLIPNRALQSMISQWCLAYEIHTPDSDPYAKTLLACYSSTRAEINSNRATTKLRIRLLSRGSSDVKTVAVKALCSIVITGKDNWGYIVEAGAVPRLQKLLSSLDQFAQESAMTIIMYLSMQHANKSLVMEQEGCLGVIIGVLTLGHTDEARENAAFTLFFLCEIHEYNRINGGKDGAIYALIRLFKEGTEKGQMIAVKTLHRLSSHVDNCIKLVEARAIKALGEALKTEELVEDAAGALGFLAQQTIGAEAIRGDRVAMSVLLELIRSGSPREKKIAYSVLKILFRLGINSRTQRLDMFLAVWKRAKTSSSSSFARVRQRAIR